MISIDNAAEMLLLADGQSCALLKETAMELVARNPSKMTKTSGWKTLQQSSSLLAEVFMHQSVTPAADIDDDNENLDHVRVSGLRKRLAEQGRDVDGTKEMLVKRLKAGQDQDVSNAS